MGYARGKCERVPDGSADAVRVCLAEPERVMWVIEKAHLPVVHGSVAPGESTRREGLLDSQIAAYLRPESK